jgi:protein-S-isoprenylcysteine O-methyltransferase Ste14
MASEPLTQSQHVQSDAGVVARAGGWLFRHRTIIPIPLVLAILIVPADAAPASAALTAPGAALVLLGEGLRLWGVHHIGVISRTRSDRLGPLIDTGPFAFVRNPLYLGNIALWVGFALYAQLVWLAPIIAVLLFLEYHAIVRWEEQLLIARLGEPYREYQRRVPRWVPKVRLKPDTPYEGPSEGPYEARGWGDAFFSERGTLMAIAAGVFLLWLKARS